MVQKKYIQSMYSCGTEEQMDIGFLAPTRGAIVTNNEGIETIWLSSQVGPLSFGFTRSKHLYCASTVFLLLKHRLCTGFFLTRCSKFPKARPPDLVFAWAREPFLCFF